MDYLDQPSTAAYSFDQAVEFAESTSDDYFSTLETFDDETDSWPLCEPEANNLGDC